VKRVKTALALAIAIVLCACSADDGASGRSKLIGNYRLIVPADQATPRKDFAGSALRLSGDGMFTLQCRYKNGRTDSVIGTWTYSDRRARFSAFKDCAGVMPTGGGKGDISRTLVVDFDLTTRIVVSRGVNARYERHGSK
jgi:hypothetical protein